MLLAAVTLCYGSAQASLTAPLRRNFNTKCWLSYLLSHLTRGKQGFIHAGTDSPPQRGIHRSDPPWASLLPTVINVRVSIKFDAKLKEEEKTGTPARRWFQLCGTVGGVSEVEATVTTSRLFVSTAAPEVSSLAELRAGLHSAGRSCGTNDSKQIQLSVCSPAKRRKTARELER